jgi:hypothetical protein
MPRLNDVGGSTDLCELVDGARGTRAHAKRHEFDLGKASLEELTAIIQMLGRLPCSGSTKG